MKMPQKIFPGRPLGTDGATKGTDRAQRSSNRSKRTAEPESRAVPASPTQYATDGVDPDPLVATAPHPVAHPQPPNPSRAASESSTLPGRQPPPRSPPDHADAAALATDLTAPSQSASTPRTGHAEVSVTFDDAREPITVRDTPVWVSHQFVLDALRAEFVVGHERVQPSSPPRARRGLFGRTQPEASDEVLRKRRAEQIATRVADFVRNDPDSILAATRAMNQELDAVASVHLFQWMTDQPDLADVVIATAQTAPTYVLDKDSRGFHVSADRQLPLLDARDPERTAGTLMYSIAHTLGDDSCSLVWRIEFLGQIDPADSPTSGAGPQQPTR